jgi:hypothetical protein
VQSSDKSASMPSSVARSKRSGARRPGADTVSFFAFFLESLS